MTSCNMTGVMCRTISLPGVSLVITLRLPGMSVLIIEIEVLAGGFCYLLTETG